jgi:hypothetical protein
MRPITSNRAPMIWKKLMNGFFMVNKKASGLLSKGYGTGKGGNNQI